MEVQSLILDYVPQIDAVTCQSAAIARVVGDHNVAKIRRELLRLGTPGDPAVMGEYLRPRVKDYCYLGNGCLADAIDAIDAGYQLITHGWFTGSGHIIGISGWDLNTQTFIAEDPWYEFHFQEWSYEPYAVDGDDMNYSARGIWAACVVGHSPDDAFRCYLEAAPRLTKEQFRDRGMWLHMIKN